MKTFVEDMVSPLDEASRAWIRIPATILLSPLALTMGVVMGIGAGIVDAFQSFIIPCWKGDSK